jgi:hypothetical protein
MTPGPAVWDTFSLFFAARNNFSVLQSNLLVAVDVWLGLELEVAVAAGSGEAGPRTFVCTL